MDKVDKKVMRGREKKETESVLVEFENREFPKGLYLGYVRYSIRAFFAKPMRCFKCQEYDHIACLLFLL